MMRPLLRPCAALLLLAACAAADPVATAPSGSEWRPVAEAVSANTPDAIDKVKAIAAKYPKWSDGQRTLAGQLAQRSEWLEAYRAAKRAIDLNPADAGAGEIAVLALGQLNKPADAARAAALFASNDSKGRIAYQAAAAVLAGGNAVQAAQLLAPALAIAPVPAEFLVLDGRIAAAGGDHVRAESTLAKATGLRRELADAWYLLGLERMELAELQPTDRGRWLTLARDAFQQTVAQRPRDADALTAFGKTLLELAKHSEATGAAGKSDLLVQARGVLTRALSEKPTLIPALLFIGEVHLRCESWNDAAMNLQKAVDLGANDQDTLLLLVKAYGNAGDTTKATELGRLIKADSTGERIIIGIASYRAGDHVLAAALLSQAADDQAQDPGQRGALLRYVGHANRRAAERAALASGQAPNADKQAQLRVQEHAARDRARDAYLAAGDLGDYDARRWLVGAESVRSPEAAHAAAGKALGWSAFDLSAAMLWLGTYPEAATGGQGFAGWWSRHPIHVVVFGLLALIPLVMFVRAVTRKPTPQSAQPIPAKTKPKVAEVTPRAGARSVPKSTPTPTAVKSGTKPAVRTPVPASRVVTPRPETRPATRPATRPVNRPGVPKPPPRGDDPNSTQPM